MERDVVEIGDIMQIDPRVPKFGSCFMTVTEPKMWGAQGYVQNAGQEGQAFYRCKFEDMEPTGGKAVWVIPDIAAEVNSNGN